ncbi:helix-turn-helix domain-containing protein [Streptomyces fradiae]|uniref:helix-turn-helix domain-containing protein n=1 Tax=Streptomyces fradiae TaxID=1906 RepID=UPI003815E4B9
MGRRENAVAAETRALETLALWLRAQRQRPGGAPLTYAAMAEKIEYEVTASMLSRAASGRTIPTRRVVEAYARACGADLTEARRLWKAARAAEQERRRQRSAEYADLAVKLDKALSHPRFIESEGQLRRAMVQLRAHEGQPSLAELQEWAGKTPEGRHRLPKSSLSAVFRGEAVPTRGLVTAFTEALGLSRRRVSEWERAWDRVVGGAGPEPPGLPRRPSARLWILEASHTVFQPPHGSPDVPTVLLDGTVDAMSFHTAVTGDVVEGDWYAPPLRLLFSRPSKWRWRYGPQPPLPPVGRTHSGLPIRAPRRYPSPAPALHTGQGLLSQ